MSSKYIYSVILEGQTSYDILLPSAQTDYIQRTIAEAGRPYEHDMLKDMASRLVPGDVVVDIGSNIGNHTLFLAIVAKVKVLAVEPNTQLVAALEKSVEINRLQDSVSIVNCGLGSESGSAYFTEEVPENLGSQRLTAGLGDIPIKTLTEIQPDRPIRLIKVDVEGMELEVLKGAKEIIEEDKPFIYVECQDLENYSTIESYLNELGYLVGETFNATPTHLFVHETATSPFALRDVLHRKIEKAIYEQPAKLAQLSDRLHQANLKYREANQRIDTLKQRLELQHGEQGTQELKRFEEFEIAREENIVLSNKLAELNAELMSEKKISNQLQTKQLETESKLRGLELEHQKKSQLELEALTCQLQKVNTQLDEEKRHVIQVNSKLTSAEKALNETEQRYQLEKETWKNRERELSDLKAATEGMLMETEKKFERLESDHKLTKKRLEEASAKYRKATGEVIPTLKHQLETLRVNLEQTSRELIDQKKRSVLIAQQIRELRASIMFRLGYAIVEGATSLNGAKNLPARLFRIGIDALNKIKESNKKDNNKRKLDRQVARVKKVSQKENKQKANLLTELPEPIHSYKPLEEKLSVERSDLKIACVMDEFTYTSYAPTAHLKQLTPEAWKEQLEEFMPELLFIESAWRGKDELWGSKVGHNAVELQGIIEWCKLKEIPTVFWNKEDPVHFQTFINTAKNFDYVFTTDVDCIGKYKGMLGHERVFFLPFACQPIIHNPLEKYQRKDVISFAGAYYSKYPERAKDLADFVTHLSYKKDVEIFDRNFGKNDPSYQFPANYQPFIVGTLPHKKIDIAYKGYKYAINLNSIKQSQSMFARRVFELMACNTTVLSNFSKGLRLMFGELITATDSGKTIVDKIDSFEKDKNLRDKIKLANLRKVLSEHTYQHRLEYIREKVFNIKSSNRKLVHIFSIVKDQNEFSNLIESFSKQVYQNKSLTLFIKNNIKLDDKINSAINLVEFVKMQKKSLQEIFGENEWIGYMSPSDYYGPNYLTDMMDTLSYLEIDAIGKANYFQYKNEEFSLISDREDYSEVSSLPVNSSIIKSPDISLKKIEKLKGSNWLPDLMNGIGYTIDRFSYCKFGLGVDKVIDAVDIEHLKCGKPLQEIQKIAENIAPIKQKQTTNYLSKYKVYELFNKSRAKHVKVDLSDSGVEINSLLQDGKHEYIYASELLPVDELLLDNGANNIEMYCDASPGLQLSLVLIYKDDKMQRLGHEILSVNSNLTPLPPFGTSNVLLGFRVLSSGNAVVNKIELSHRDLQLDHIFTTNKILVLSNNYPSYDDLYKNGFVHTRVKSYQELGTNVDVFRYKKGRGIKFDEFQDVDVITGGDAVLRKVLKDADYSSIAVHFLDSDMWKTLTELPKNIAINVWLHGAEIHPWWRRKYNYTSNEELEKAKIYSEERLKFWRSLLKEMPSNLHIIFVSKSFANEVFEDLGFSLPNNKYSIINNPVNTDIFSYRKKDKSQRFKLLSIRPFASRQYANDLTIDAIKLLSNHPIFNQLEILIVGDGKLFNELTKPLEGFPNVELRKKFLTHSEIAELHKEFGLFICPTRWDSQGVSRDEAMSSGLIPITTNVAAIPEFTSVDCAYVVEPEQANLIYDAILDIVNNEDLFENMSIAASNRVSNYLNSKKIARKELDLLVSGFNEVQ